MKANIPRYDVEKLAGLPDDGQFFCYTNSERANLMCPRKYLYAYGHQIEFDGDSRPLRYGSAFHEVMEDLHLWLAHNDSRFDWEEYQKGDCLHCSGEGCGLCKEGKNKLEWVRRDWEQFVGDGTLDPKSYADDLRTLTSAVNAYLIHWGADPCPIWKVVGVELQLAMPVVDPRNDQPFKPTMILVDDCGELRLPKPGEVGAGEVEHVRVNWPWFKIGKMDALVQHRRTGRLMIREHKTSGSPATYLAAREFDPQTPGYSSLIDYNLKAGTLSLIKPVMEPTFDGDVEFDVAYSGKLIDPQILKNGSLSKRKAKTYSWDYEAKVKSMGLDRSDYSDHIEALRASVDEKLMLREVTRVSQDAMVRDSDENFAWAARIARVRNSMALAKVIEDLNIAAPRMPMCTMAGGYCSYKGACAADQHDHFSGYREKTGPTWSDSKKS